MKSTYIFGGGTPASNLTGEWSIEAIRNFVKRKNKQARKVFFEYRENNKPLSRYELNLLDGSFQNVT